MSNASAHITRIIVAESHEIIRIGLRTLISNQPTLHLLAETETIDELFMLIDKHKPDVILLDLALDNVSYLNHIPALIQACPQSRVLAYSSNIDEETHIQVLRLGAAGIVAKDHSSDLLIKAIHAVNEGQVWFDRQITKLLWQSNLDSPIVCYETNADQFLLSKLTKRELSVARLASQGASAKRIAEELSISEKTVRNKLTLIYEKLEVDGQIDLCLKATELGL